MKDDCRWFEGTQRPALFASLLLRSVFALQSSDCAGLCVNHQLIDHASRLGYTTVALTERTAVNRTFDFRAQQRVLVTQRIHRPPETRALHAVTLRDHPTNSRSIRND